jgi:hypothetical protein
MAPLFTARAKEHRRRASTSGRISNGSTGKGAHGVGDADLYELGTRPQTLAEEGVAIARGLGAEHTLDGRESQPAGQPRGAAG